MKKILKWILYIVVALAVIGYFAGDKKDSPATESTSSESVPVTSTPAKEVYKTTATALFKDYDDNEVAADEKMKGKIIEVSGTVQSIDKDFTDSIIVRLKTSNEFLPAIMGVKDSEKSTALALKKGQKVVVTCASMSRMVGAPSGRNCIFAN
ncbi:OB-fold putative lipoprotein [Serratia quinivorans]|uniref:OB-fold putative lipoprotein n=1 Tax=Serratia quinivorans TaxID=137545 RepID=UPI00217C4D83|nr:OB-fold putative lipoprotein [Serratia quinivorans]CAI0716224.1 tRNA_anti-like [Serratia quinivorans]CAI1521704.1 tRNA_anti-like [Serratia quinivorans]